MNQEEYFGVGSIKNLSNVLSKSDAKRIFLVTGKKSFASSGAEKIFGEMLKGYKIKHFNEFTGNPNLEDVEKGIIEFKKSNADMVIAVGGGSVIDTAKLINIFSEQENIPDAFIKGKEKIFNKGKTLIAIPTTSGAGSEATHFAVVYKGKEKFSIAYKNILPDIVIIDPQFTFSLPPIVTATSGIDAFCQAIESYWSVNSTIKSKEFSVESLKLILDNLDSSVNNPKEEVRINMSKAANLAGKAINITKTTAPHAVSYSMTSYFNVPHGQAVGVTLGEFMIYNYGVDEMDLVDSRGMEYVKNSIDELVKLMKCQDVYEAKNKISKLMNGICLKIKLSDLGIKDERDLKIIEENVNLERLQNNPRAVSKDGLRKILRNIL